MKRCFSLAWLGLVTWCLSAGLQAQSLPTGVTAQAHTAAVSLTHLTPPHHKEGYVCVVVLRMKKKKYR